MQSVENCAIFQSDWLGLRLGLDSRVSCIENWAILLFDGLKRRVIGEFSKGTNTVFLAIDAQKSIEDVLETAAVTLSLSYFVFGDEVIGKFVDESSRDCHFSIINNSDDFPQIGCCWPRDVRKLIGIEAHPVLILHIPLRSHCLMRLNILQQLQLILRQGHHLLTRPLLPLSLFMSHLPLNSSLQLRTCAISFKGGLIGSTQHYYQYILLLGGLQQYQQMMNQYPSHETHDYK